MNGLSDPIPAPGLGFFVDEFVADRDSVGRRHRLTYSNSRLDRMARLLRDWEGRLDSLPFEDLDPAGKIDDALMRNQLRK
ncbi:hypothetical protein EON82_19660, partial [bacterium]